MEPTENQIIVYQPNGVMKIDVRFDGETVWLLQGQIAELFSCSLENVRLHLKNIYACGELEKMTTSKESLEVRKESNRGVVRNHHNDCKTGLTCFTICNSPAQLNRRHNLADFCYTIPT